MVALPLGRGVAEHVGRIICAAADLLLRVAVRAARAPLERLNRERVAIVT